MHRDSQTPEAALSLPDPAPVRALLQHILETGSRWSETGNDPRTDGVSCWGLVRFAFAQGGIVLPESAAEADHHFVPVSPPYQAWDMPLFDFRGIAHGPRHVGILLTPQVGYHSSRATNGVARFDLRHGLWQRVLHQVVRLRGTPCA